MIPSRCHWLMMVMAQLRYHGLNEEGLGWLGRLGSVLGKCLGCMIYSMIYAGTTLAPLGKKTTIGAATNAKRHTMYALKGIVDETTIKYERIDLNYGDYVDLISNGYFCPFSQPLDLFSIRNGLANFLQPPLSTGDYPDTTSGRRHDCRWQDHLHSRRQST